MGTTRPQLFAIALALIPLAVGALPTAESRRTARILDDASGQPLPTVLFAVEEGLRVPTPIHGSSNTCVRYGAAIGREAEAAVTLPPGDIGLLSRIRGES